MIDFEFSRDLTWNLIALNARQTQDIETEKVIESL